MIDEKELVDLMTKSGEAYLKDNTEEGTLYAKELIHKLDFSEQRDQNVLLNVLVNALVKHDEFSGLDELGAAGFDFNMKFKDGRTLPLFFSKYLKFNTDDRVYKKMEELGAKSLEDTISADKIHKTFEKNLYTYNLWWEKDEAFYDPRCQIASKEYNETILELVKKISNSSAEMTGDKGISILHHVVWHNFYEAAEILLKNGVNPDVKGVQGRGNSDNGYLGTTPLHLACYMGNYKMAKLLIDNGADTTICDDRGRNCFHYLSCIHFENAVNTFTGQTESIEQRFDIIPLLKCDINAKDNSGITPFLYLLKNDRSAKFAQKMIQTFIDNGADVTVTDENGNTALTIAAEKNQVTAAMILIKYKDMINLQNNDGDTALHIAAREWHNEIAYILLDIGADYSIKNNNGETAEEIIKDNDNETLCTRLGKRRSDPPSVLAKIIQRTFFDIGRDDNDRFDFALYLIEKMMKDIDEDDDEDVENVIEILYNSLQDDNECKVIETIAKSGFDLTMTISYHRDLTNVRDYCLNEFYGVNLIKKLMELGVDMDTALIKGKTPANIVARMSSEDKVFFDKSNMNYYAEAAKLFSRESMEELDQEGTSAVHQAARNNHLEMMQVMIDKGVDINLTEDAPQEVGSTPLHVACTYGRPDMIKLLMSAGADDSIQNASGETAAHIALQRKIRYKEIKDDVRAEMIEALSDIDTPRDDGKTPLILLQTLDDINAIHKITPILIDKGADVNHADNRGNTALLIHTDRNCDRDIVKEFIRAGADLNAQDANGNTALIHALKYGNSDVARLLIKKGADYNIANNKGETAVEIAVEKGYETILVLMTDIKVNSVSDNNNSSNSSSNEKFYEGDGNTQSSNDIFDSDDEDDDYAVAYNEIGDNDEPEQLSDFDKFKNMYVSIFGEVDGIKLAEYMAEISKMNSEGLNDENRDKFTEVMGKYQELLNSLGGMQKIIEYSQHFYDKANEDDDDDDYIDEEDYYDEDDEDDEDEDDENDDDEESTVGIDAINDAVENLYKDQKGFCYGVKVPYALGGNDPLDMVQIYESNSGGIPHWHYITCGFTELYDKESDDEEVSGFGFELTFRLKKIESQPPVWPVNLLQNLARYVFKTGNTFAPGHHMNANGSIQLGYDSDITALAFVKDYELPDMETENGSFEFIQIIGITNDEMQAAMCWDCEKLMNVFEEFMPLGITDLDRKSFMGIEKVKSAFENGVEVDGSSTAYIFTDRMSLVVKKSGKVNVLGTELKENELAMMNGDGIALFTGAGHIKNIMTMLKGRLLKDRDFMVRNNENSIFFALDEKCGISVDEDNDIEIRLTEDAINEMSQKLEPKAGVYEFESTSLKVVLMITEIRDNDGNIIERIG